VDLDIQGVNAGRKCLLPSTSRNAMSQESEKRKSSTLYEWSTIKREYQHLKNFQVQLITGTNNSDLILPKQIVKPSGQPEVGRVSYGVESLLNGRCLIGYPVSEE